MLYIESFYAKIEIICLTSTYLPLIFATGTKKNSMNFSNRKIMKTLDYLHLNEKKVADVVSALHQLLADFQVHYTNLRGFHCCTANLKICTTMPQRKWMKSQNVS